MGSCPPLTQSSPQPLVRDRGYKSSVAGSSTSRLLDHPSKSHFLYPISSELQLPMGAGLLGLFWGCRQGSLASGKGDKELRNRLLE